MPPSGSQWSPSQCSTAPGGHAMRAVRSVLVVGSGAAGTAAAILLAEQGVSVDVVEAKPDVAALGSGITIQGNALRVLRQLGVWDQVRDRGYAFDTLGIRAPTRPAPSSSSSTTTRPAAP